MREDQAVSSSATVMDTAGNAASLGISPDDCLTVLLGPAGSGKTTALVEMAATIIAAGTPRDGVLVLAVSRQGADDLARRLAARLGASAPAVATFHSFAFNLARSHYQQAGYGSPPRFLAANQLWDELRRALSREDVARWPRYGGRLGSRSLLALINDLISGAANNGLSPEETCRLLAEHGRPDLVELAEFSGRYQRQLKEHCLLSAELAVTEALHLLEGSAGLLSSYRAHYPHLLVDQFEDATYAQARLARLLGGGGLFVAGNPLMAVNSYRGGSPAHLQSLIDSPQARILSLDSSHRPAVAAMRADSWLFPATVQGPEDPSTASGHVATVHNFRYQSEESAWITRQVASLLRSGIAPREIAVLFRTGSDPLARDLALRLARAGIPARSTLFPASVGADPMVAAAVNVPRYLSAGPEERPDAFLKLLSSPLGGLTRAEIRILRRVAQDSHTSALSMARDSAAMGALPEDVAAAVSEMATRLASLEALGPTSPDGLLWHVWTTFPAFARQTTGGGARDGDSLASPAAYRAFLEEVASIVEDRESTSIGEIISLYDGGRFHELDVPGPRGNGLEVSIATIHQSRNAEWRYLFLPNLVEGIYPLRQSPIGNLAPMLLRAGPGEPEGLAERHLAEERRIFYVALSRAVERVHLSSSGIAFDGTTRLVPSRYLSLLGLEESPDTEDGPAAHSPEEMVAHYRRHLRAADPTDQTEALHALARLSELQPHLVDPSRWWDNLDVAEGAAPAHPGGSLHLSASRLSSYRACPLAFKFGQYLRLEDISSDAMTLGTLLHDVLEAYHAPSSHCPRTREALEALVEERYDPAAFSRPPVARQVRRRITELLDLYFPKYGQAGGAVAVEAAFSFQLGPHTVAGRIDRIDRLPDGTLELIDYKSGSAMSYGEAEGDIQLALYALAFDHVPELAAMGSPGRATYLYIKTIGPKADGRRSYQPTEEGQQRLLARIDRYSRGILAELFPSRFHILDTWADLEPEEVERVLKADPCRYCSFTWLCPEMERGLADG